MLVIIYRLKKILVFLILGFFYLSAQSQVYSLQQCIDTAMVYNKSIQISINTKKIGEQKYKESKANLIPKINANTDYRYYTNQPYQLMPLSIFGAGPAGKYKEAQFGVPHNVNANLQITMPLYHPQIYGAIQTTRIAFELSELQNIKTNEQIYFEISNLYYNVQILNHQIIFIDSNYSNSTKLLKNIQLLREQLLAKGTDVNKIQLQAEQLQLQKELIRNKRDQVLDALKFYMGISIDRDIQTDTIIQYHENNEYADTTNIDLLVSKKQNLLVQSELRSIKNSRMPTLSIFGMYGTTGFGYDKTPNEFLKFYPIGFAGIQLTYPLFNGTVTQRKINQKKLELQSSDLQVKLLSEQNAMHIKNANRQKMLAKQSLATILSQIKMAQSIYDQTVLQQKQGLASLTDVLLADTTLRESQQAYIAAIIDYLKADLELKKLTGNIKY